jgi:hypothetical protein
MFSRDEDARLRFLVARYGEENWKLISREMRSRSPRQCRERYKNYLSPQLSTRPWAESEDELLRKKFREIGPRWAQMSAAFVGRSDVAIKNRWAAICARDGPPVALESPGGAIPSGPDAVRGRASEFSISRLLWNPGDTAAPMKTEIAVEDDRRDRGLAGCFARLCENTLFG